MTMPHERIRALLWAGGFFIELARDESLPLEVRQRAVAIARHFPTVENIGLMASLRHSTELRLGWWRRKKPVRGTQSARSVRCEIPRALNGRNTRRHVCQQGSVGHLITHNESQGKPHEIRASGP